MTLRMQKLPVCVCVCLSPVQLVTFMTIRRRLSRVQRLLLFSVCLSSSSWWSY